jgi:hypothetical protein
LLLFLAMVDKWTDCEDLADLLPATPKDELPATIHSLLEANAVVEEDSALAIAEEEFVLS